MLRSLEIKNFRTLEDFRVDRLGRVNLIVGKNNSGKSTVLEALRIYAGNANRGLLETIAAEHDEPTIAGWKSPERAPFDAFLTGRQSNEDRHTFVIGEHVTHPDAMTVEYGVLDLDDEHSGDGGDFHSLSRLVDGVSLANSIPAIRVTRGGKVVADFRLDRHAKALVRKRAGDTAKVPCGVIPTGFVSIDELAAVWDGIALTDGQGVVGDALRIIAPEFEGLAFVQSEATAVFRRTARVKLANVAQPVPLKSLGDGMLRVLQLALELFAAKGGLFLIDEFENGLHYSVQQKVWTLLFTMAERLGVQIFATTHSWDCIESFASAAKASPGEGVLFRVGRSVRASERGRVIATVFDEEQLFNITQADVEVR